MWPTKNKRRVMLEKQLNDFAATKRQLPGVHSSSALNALTFQMIASLRRLEYTEIAKLRDISPLRADPNSAMFDPEKAAILHLRAGNVDEAFWLVFLLTHFGKHPLHGWKRLQDVYSGLGLGAWTWDRVSQDPVSFRTWLRKHRLRIGGAFGNHRKYESLDADSPSGTGAIVQSYISWVGPTRSHATLVSGLVRKGGNDPQRIFEIFYNDMGVKRFGRLGKFDFLALVGRLGLAPIEPGSAYLQGSTGPLRGARLLFGGSTTAPLDIDTLEHWIQELDNAIHIGMQSMEDSLCNWQKSPQKFIHFRG